MLKHRASEGPAELQRGTTLIQETPGVRQSYSCVSFQRHRLSVICRTHNAYCSPLSMAEPRNLSFIFAEGAYYVRILICETPRDSQCGRSSARRGLPVERRAYFFNKSVAYSFLSCNFVLLET